MKNIILADKLYILLYIISIINLFIFIIIFFLFYFIDTFYVKHESSGINKLYI